MFIKDNECTKDTPVIMGYADTPVYGKRRRIKPKMKGREDSEHFTMKHHLPGSQKSADCPCQTQKS